MSSVYGNSDLFMLCGKDEVQNQGAALGLKMASVYMPAR